MLPISVQSSGMTERVSTGSMARINPSITMLAMAQFKMIIYGLRRASQASAWDSIQRTIALGAKNIHLVRKRWINCDDTERYPAALPNPKGLRPPGQVSLELCKR